MKKKPEVGSFVLIDPEDKLQLMDKDISIGLVCKANRYESTLSIGLGKEQKKITISNKYLVPIPKEVPCSIVNRSYPRAHFENSDLTTIDMCIDLIRELTKKDSNKLELAGLYIIRSKIQRMMMTEIETKAVNEFWDGYYEAVKQEANTEQPKRSMPKSSNKPTNDKTKTYFNITEEDFEKKCIESIEKLSNIDINKKIFTDVKGDMYRHVIKYSHVRIIQDIPNDMFLNILNNITGYTYPAALNVLRVYEILTNKSTANIGNVMKNIPVILFIPTVDIVNILSEYFNPTLSDKRDNDYYEDFIDSLHRNYDSFEEICDTNDIDIKEIIYKIKSVTKLYCFDLKEGLSIRDIISAFDMLYMVMDYKDYDNVIFKYDAYRHIIDDSFDTNKMLNTSLPLTILSFGVGYLGGDNNE